MIVECAGPRAEISGSVNSHETCHTECVKSASVALVGYQEGACDGREGERLETDNIDTGPCDIYGELIQKAGLMPDDLFSEEEEMLQLI